MSETEFEYRGHWVHIYLSDVGENLWRATYAIDTNGAMDVAGRPISYQSALSDARRNAKAAVDRAIQRAAADGNTVVLYGTSHYRFPDAERAAEARAWLSLVVPVDGDIVRKFPDAELVAFIGGSQTGIV